MTQEQIKNEISSLDNAYKMKLLSTDEYCSQLHSLLKKLKDI